MRRIALWFLSTLTVVVLLFGYHTSTAGVSGVGTSTSIVSEGIAATTTQGSTDPPASSSPTASASSTPSTTPSPTPSTTTITGTAVETRYGPVQVVLTVTGGQVTNVAVPQYPTNDPRDAEINGYALPVLVHETLEAQSAQIDMVSGATFTSEGYLASLQSALDQAGI